MSSIPADYFETFTMCRVGLSLVSLAAAILLCSCKGDGIPVAERLSRAKQLTAAGEIQKARVELDAGLKAEPRNPQLNLELAHLEDAQGDIRAAIPHYLMAATPDARLIEPQLRIIGILIDSDRLPEALGRVNTTLGSFPNDSDALAARADIEQRSGQDAQALTDVTSSLSHDPQNTRALAVAALLKLRNKDLAGAQAIVDQGLGKHPNDLRLLQVQAALAVSAQSSERAISAFRAIIHARPENVVAQRALAQLEAQSGHFDEALAGLKAAVAADPSNPDMQLALVDFLSEQKKASEVISYLQQLIAQQPDDATYVLMLAEFYRKSGDLQRSVATLQTASARLGDSPAGTVVKVALAKSDVNEDRFASATDLLDTILNRDPDNAQARQVRAVLALKNAHYQAAISDLLEIVRRDPVNSHAFDELATAYTATGDLPRAVDAMRRAAAVSPGDADTQIRLAAFLQGSKAEDASREIMSRLTLNQPLSASVWAANGQLAIARKSWDEAARSVTRLHSIPEAETQALTLQADLDAARGKTAEAFAELKAVLQTDRNVDAATIGAFARAAVRAGKSSEAATFLEGKSTSLSGPALEAALITQMTLWADAGEFGRLDAAFHAAARKVPQSLNLYTAYSGILSRRKDYAKARAAIDQGIAAGASRWSMLLLRGSVDNDAGDMRSALDDYKAAYEANPFSVEALNDYASLLADQDPKNLDTLRALKARLDHEEASSNPYYVDTVAWIDYRLGNYDQAKALLTRIDAGHSENPQLRFHLAAVLLASGDRSGASALLDTLKGLTFPGSDEARGMSAT